MNRIRVLVCGSNYGRTYITALARNPRKYELAGILGRGSLRSYEVAARKDVPLYRSAAEIPDNIDLACAAMNSAAFPVVLQLIRRGVHVLCEHPYPSSLLKKAMDLAKKRSLQFHVNGHFANLPAPATFIRACRRILKTSSPELVEIMTTERALYSTVDILLSALGSLHSFRACALSRNTRFVLLEGVLGTVPCRVSVQVSGQRNEGRLPDGSSGYLLDQRLTVLFPTGVLTLFSTAGPVLWNRNPVRLSNRKEPLWVALSGEKPQTGEAVGEQRIKANVAALDAIRKSMLGHAGPEAQQSRHILQVSKAWETIGRLLYSS